MTGGSDLRRMAGEVVLVALLFAAAGAWPVPDVNETVYLTKARHAADPAWAAGDWFLETPDAHGVFYLLFAPVAAAVPLEQAAWIGRWAGWLAVATGFLHAVRPLLATSRDRLLAAALFAVLVRVTTAAGEWVLGGCESKVFAWALVFGGIGEFVRGRDARSWCLLGAATAVHPLVGGWGMAAEGIVLMTAAVRQGIGRGPRPLAAALVAVGCGLALAGVVPALELGAGVDAAGRAAATRIYVVERLHHHLLLRSFPEPMVVRHLLAILAWILLGRAAAATPARRRLAAFTTASLAISAAGCLISLAETVAPTFAYALLRYYWFRLADIVVPLALAVNAAAVLGDDDACRLALPGRPVVLRGLVWIALAADLAGQSRHWPLPGRSGLVPRADTKVDPVAWADICGWVRDHTPDDAVFLTPRGAASFTWRTGRREVVAWKNSPQDAASLLEWRRRIVDCFSADGGLADAERSTAALGAERMRAVAARYGADHAIVPLDVDDVDSLPFRRLHANDRYVVFSLVAEPAPENP